MNDDIKLTDLFEVEMLQRIQDAFSKMTGFASIITDANGKPVTKGSNFTDFCKLYTRNSPIGCLRCEQCDKHGAEIALKVGASVTYYCHAGLLDFAAPIMAGQNMIGCFVGGQVLTEPPDITKVMQVAAELDVELINYLQSVITVRVMDKQVVEDAAFFLYTLTDILSSIAYHKYEMHQANIEIEKVANMKSDFLANMSHEIRTPMNAVIGMAEMAMREELPASARDYVSQIKSSGKTLLTIINDILDFSKIESGKMDIHNVEYEPLSLINDVVNIMNTRIQSDDVSLILNINPQLPKTLYGDNIRIKQVITNIFNNAVKFTQKGQVMLKIDYQKTDSKHIDLLISVHDTGIGIKKEDMNKLFKSFQQVDSKRNRNIEGTGLGLAISRQLLSLMGGDIQADSEYGKGSTFSFHLPQKVIDFTPGTQLKEKKTHQCIGYIQNEYVQTQLLTDLLRLEQNYSNITSLVQLSNIQISDNAYLFVEQHLFQHPLHDYVKRHPDLTCVVLVPYNASVSYPDQNIQIVKKPLSVVSLAAIFNHEEISQEYLDDASDNLYDFSAPNANVLIVDDNSVNLTVAEGLLKPLQMNIDTATSAKAAISKIETKKYDLILMDHMMPDIDGVEATHIIRRFHKDYENTPILALTANAVAGVQEMFLAEGMNDFVAKPIEIRSLLRKIHKWLPPGKIQSAVKLHTKTNTSSNTPITIEGLDTKAALTMLGSEELFWSVLKDYYHAIPKKLALIKELEEEEDWKNYTIEVHALKSVSRQIGALELSQKALDMENAGNAADAEIIHKKTDPMLKQYYNYFYILRPYFPEELIVQEEDSLDNLISPDILADAFEKMQVAMDNLDMDGMNEVVQILSSYQFPTEQTKFFQKFCNAVENLDVDTCEEIIPQWKEKAGIS